MSENKAVQQTKTEQAKAQSGSETFIRPDVDIYEDATGITLKADLPGVSRERLDVQVDNDTLTISGEAAIDMPEGMEPIYADINTTHYRRSFTLSKELDLDQISAELKNGELTLRLPKRAEVQPRKIEVKAA